MTTLNLISYNIRYGGQGREAVIAEVLRAHQPDLVIFQEATDTRVVDRIAGLLEMPLWDARRGQSLAFMSRVPLERYRWHRIGQRMHLVLEIVPQGMALGIFGVHLRPHPFEYSEYRRLEEVRRMLRVVQRREGSHPHLFIGDFNTVAPGDVLDVRRFPRWIRFLVRLNRSRVPRKAIGHLLGEGYIDAFRHLHRDDPGFTLPSYRPNARLDYAIMTKALLPALDACEVLHSPEAVRTASDHLPLRIQLSLEKVVPSA